VEAGAVEDTLVLPLRSSLVSYYTLTPTGDNAITAGDSITFTVTARDQFGNAIANSGSLNLFGVGSSTEEFSPGPYDFAGSDTLQFWVSDTITGSFTVRVENTGNAAIIGQSGLVTVNSAAVDSLVFSPAGNITINAGADLIYVITALDQFGNSVTNNNTLDINFSPSGTQTAVPANPVFNNADTVLVTVSDTETGIFRVLTNVQGSPQIDGQSGLITVSTASPHHLVKVSNEDSITVGTTRLMEVRVEDEFDNPIPGRIRDSLVVLYTFDEGSGTQVTDVSGNGTAMNLTVENPASVTWDGSGFLDINAPARISTATAGTKVYNAVTATNEMTVEAWITPSRIGGNTGPARIVTLSLNASLRNFTLAQDGSDYIFRLRTSDDPPAGGDNNGMDNITTPGSIVTTSLTHIVFTRDVSGQYYIYIDGNEVVSGSRTGDFGNWAPTYQFGLGAEFTEALASRDWWGDLHLVAVYNRAIDSLEVVQNYIDGADNSLIFSRVSAGDGVFVASDSSAQAAAIDSNGLANADYRASTLAASGPDIIQAAIGDVNTTFTMPLKLDTPSNLVVSDTSAVVGSPITLRVRLEDQFSNPITNATLNFSETGNGNLSSPTGVTDASGFAEVVYTLGTDTSASPEEVVVQYLPQSLADTIRVTLLTAPVSYYTLTPSGDSTIVAGDSIDYTLSAFDQYGNPVASSDSVTLSAVGSITAGFSAGPYEFNGLDTLAFQVSDTTSGSFTVNATNIDNPVLTIQSGLITVGVAAAANIEKVSGDATGLVAGSDRLLRVKITDTYNNVVSGDSVRFIVHSGGGSFSGSDSVGVESDSLGIGEVYSLRLPRFPAG
jgi:hypothetical protein